MTMVQMFVCDNCGHMEEVSNVSNDAISVNLDCWKFNNLGEKYRKNKVTFCNIECFKKYISDLNIIFAQYEEDKEKNDLQHLLIKQQQKQQEESLKRLSEYSKQLKNYGKLLKNDKT